MSGQVARLLIVDDDPALLRVLRIALTALGYEVFTAMTGTQGISETALRAPDVVVLDLGLPDIDGVEVCRQIRQWSDVPIIVLSADGTEDRKVEALDLGADDYVTKPFSMNELQARLRVIHRRAARLRDASGLTGAPDVEVDHVTEIVVGPLRIDLVHHEVEMSGRAVKLTRREFQLLVYLARHAGRVCTHKMILDAVWGPTYGSESQYLREYAYRLRRKLGDEDGTFLRNHLGIGYELVPDDIAGHH